MHTCLLFTKGFIVSTHPCLTLIQLIPHIAEITRWWVLYRTRKYFLDPSISAMWRGEKISPKHTLASVAENVSPSTSLPLLTCSQARCGWARCGLGTGTNEIEVPLPWSVDWLPSSYYVLHCSFFFCCFQMPITSLCDTSKCLKLPLYWEHSAYRVCWTRAKDSIFFLILACAFLVYS